MYINGIKKERLYIGMFVTGTCLWWKTSPLGIDGSNGWADEMTWKIKQREVVKILQKEGARDDDNHPEITTQEGQSDDQPRGHKRGRSSTSELVSESSQQKR
jgi:hypothetical protein